MGSTILTDLVQQFLAATSAWHNTLLPIAKSLFVALAAIQLAWSAAWWVVEQDDLNPVLIALLRRILAIGFFWAVLVNAHVWVPAVIESFVAAGQRAAAAAGVALPELNPSTVLDQGIRVSSSIWSAVDTSGWLTATAGALLASLVSLLVFLAFAVIAANLVLALVEMCVVIGGGVLLLGFAGSSWTLPFAERYLSLAVSTGVKLFLLYLIVGLGTALAASWEPMIAAAGASAPDFFQVLAGALVYAVVAWNVPSYAAGLLGGSVATHLDAALRSGAVAASWTMGPVAMAGAVARPAARTTAALLETGRFAAAHRAAGGTVAGGILQSGAALGTSVALSRYHRLAGEGSAPAAAYLRERRLVRFPARPAGVAAAEVSPAPQLAPPRAAAANTPALAASATPASTQPATPEENA
jgi:type IV secretion system protein TrbL